MRSAGARTGCSGWRAWPGPQAPDTPPICRYASARSILIEELGLRQGPQLGRILDELLEKVIVDPALNDRATLLLLARSRVGDEP